MRRFSNMKNLILLSLFVLLLLTPGSSLVMAKENFTVPRRAWEQAKKDHQGDGPTIWFSTPQELEFEAENHWLRYGGCTEPSSTMTVNGKPLALNALGAFAAQITLEPGENKLVFVSTLQDKSTTRTFTINHLFQPFSKREELPRFPLRFSDAVQFNQADRYMIEAEKFGQNFYASPGGRAWFTVGDIVVPMQEMPYLPPSEEFSKEHDNRKYVSEQVAGYYRGYYKVNEKDALDHASVRFFISGPDEDGGSTKTLSFETGQTLTTDPKRVRKKAVVLENDTGIYFKPQSFGRVTSVDKDLMLETNGQANSEFTRVMLNESGDVGYVLNKYIRDDAFSEIEKKQNPPLLSGPVVRDILGQVASDDKHDSLRLKMSWPDDYPTTRMLPNKIECGADGRSLVWTIWGVRQPKEASTAEHALESLPSLHQIKNAIWQYTDAQTLVLKINLRTDRIWGFYVAQDADDIVLRIKARPLFGQQDKLPLEGLFILIDAGHGGKDDGALGSAGLSEAFINLYMAKRLAQLLQSAGARTELIRNDDSYITLDDRTAQIRASGADIFISIHNNSISESSDPIKAQGMRMFYYHGHGQHLAQTIYDNLVAEIEQQPLESHVRDHAFRLTRVNPHMPGVLVEGLFVSNPDDELRLLDPAFVDRICAGIYNGVFQWLGLPPMIRAQVMKQHVEK